MLNYMVDGEMCSVSLMRTWPLSPLAMTALGSDIGIDMALAVTALMCSLFFQLRRTDLLNVDMAGIDSEVAF